MRFQPSSELSTTDGRNSRDSNNGVRHQRALTPRLSMMMMMNLFPLGKFSTGIHDDQGCRHIGEMQHLTKLMQDWYESTLKRKRGN